MSTTMNRALVRRASDAATAALADARAVRHHDLRDMAMRHAVLADDAATMALWAIGDDDPSLLECLVSEARAAADRVLRVAAADFGRLAVG